MSASSRDFAAHVGKLRAYMGNRYSPATVASFTRSTSHFLQFAGIKPRYERDELLVFQDHLIARGYGISSIHVIMSGIRAYFRAAEIPWTLDKADARLGMITPEDAGAILAPGEIETIISRARKMGYPDLQLIALSTTFGLRNSELALALTAGCDGKVLTVQTSKLGRKRVHPIPPQLKRILTFGTYPLGGAGVHHHFDSVMNQCLRTPLKGEGWHAMRRGLITGLIQNGLDRGTLYKFIGWKPTETAMVYDRRTPGQIMDTVMAVHPYLPLWAK